MSMEISARAADRMSRLLNIAQQNDGNADFSMKTQSPEKDVKSKFAGFASDLIANPQVRSGVADFASDLFSSNEKGSNLVAVESASTKGLSVDQQKRMCVDALTDLEVGFAHLLEFIHTVESNGGVISNPGELLDIIDSLDAHIDLILNNCGDVLPAETMERVRGMRDQLQRTKNDLEPNRFEGALNLAGDVAATLLQAAAIGLSFVGQGLRHLLPQH